MSVKPESRFKEKVLRGLRALPGCFAEKIQQRSIRGTADIIACIRGWYVALELKVGAGKTDPLQDYVLESVRDAGGLAFVVTPESWDETLRMLSALPERGVAGAVRSFRTHWETAGGRKSP